MIENQEPFSSYEQYKYYARKNYIKNTNMDM